uniref:G-protein coupled receptors family 1 profile domain-containing protein n=1 Tax=Biomphalaria glabrata TaxID=6526 RepID=A0A2C9KPX0_BIOGL
MVDNNTTTSSKNEEWISDSQIYFIGTYIIQFSVKVPIRIFGLITNMLALLTFRKSGLRDGISVCFMALTLSDKLSLLANTLANLVGYFDLELHIKPYISLYYVSYIFPFYGLMFYNISTMITVFLAIQKCCCISLPWNFKSYFSKRRCIAAVCGINFVCCILNIPFTATAFPFVEAFDSTTNSTRLTFAWTKAYRFDVFPVLKAINYISIPFIAEILVLISTVILATKLKESVKFRDSVSGKTFLTRSSKSDNISSSLRTQLNSPQASNIKIYSGKNVAAQPMSTKELRATQAVNVVAILFVATNSPDVIVYMASLLFPQFSSQGFYHNTFRLCIELQDLLHVLNLSVNLFIYLKFNTKFYKTFKALFLPCFSN